MSRLTLCRDIFASDIPVTDIAVSRYKTDARDTSFSARNRRNVLTQVKRIVKIYEPINGATVFTLSESLYGMKSATSYFVTRDSQRRETTERKVNKRKTNSYLESLCPKSERSGQKTIENSFRL